MENVFALLFISLFAFLAARNFLFTLAFTTFALPAYLIRLDFGGIPYTMLEVMIWVLFLVYLWNNHDKFRWQTIQEKLKTPSHELLSLRIAMALFLFSATLAVFVSPDTRSALGVWKAYFLQPMLFFLIILGTVRTRKDLEYLWYALGLSVLTVFFFGIFQKYTGWKINPIYTIDGQVDRITSIFGFPNAIGLYLGPIAAFYFGWFASQIHSVSMFAKIVDIRWMKSCFQALVIISGIASIALAKSDGALAGIFLAAVFIGIMLKKWRSWTITAVILIAAAIAFAPSLRNAIEPKIAFTGWSEQVRLSMWSETWEMIKDHPFLGVGLSGYPIQLVRYHRTWYIEIFQYPHNILFNFWVELGLLGVIAFGWLLFEYFRLCLSLIRCSEPIGLALLAVMIEILIHGLVDVPYFKNDLSVLFWIFIASAVILSKSSSLTKKEEGVLL